MNKIKVVIFDRNGDCDENEFKLKGEVLEQVDEFVHLDNIFERTGTWDAETQRRVNAGRKVYERDD